MNCPQCQSNIQPNWAYCPHCQAELTPVELTPIDDASMESQIRGASASPNPYQAPPPHSFPPGEGDATGGLIPYKNPKALLAYYLGIFSGLPFIGFPVGIAAFVLGIMGLRDRRRNPVIKGSVHAGIGIGCGAFFTLLWGFVIVMVVIALVMEPA